MTKDEIIKALQKASGSKQIQLDSPENEEFGDYATNTALTQAQKEKKKPRELAEKIVIKLKKDETLAKITLKIEVAGPGFINFWLAKEMLALELQNVVKNGDKYGSSNVGKGKKVIVEYSSPNIAKAFGIGHLRSTIIGQAIYNLYEVLGYKVIGDNHIGDWGTQFGMIIAQVERKNLEASKLSVGDFEKLYIEFNERLQKEPKLREVAKDAFKRLESGDKTAREIWREAKRTSQDEFERIYKRLGVEIDNAYGESFYENKMGDVIDELRKKRLSKKSEGAEIVEFTHSTRSGQALPPAMLLKSDGATTYYTRDLATVKFRMDRFKPQLVIYEVGSEQILHFKQVFKTAEKLGWLKGTKLIHVPHGLIRFTHGKMATRRGETIRLEDVIDEAVHRARRIIEKSGTPRRQACLPARQGLAGQAGRGLTEEEKDTVSEMVGIGAIKYFDLSHHPSSDIIFEWEKMFVLEGNSAPYLQYTFARTQSVLLKAKLKVSRIKYQELRINEEEMAVLRSLPKFPEVIEQAAQNYSPNLLCNYLFDLAQKYNNFYARHRILDTSVERTKSEALSDNPHRILSDKRQGIDDKTSKFRLALTAGVGQILKNGLNLLGIQAPKRM